MTAILILVGFVLLVAVVVVAINIALEKGDRELDRVLNPDPCPDRCDEWLEPVR